MRVALALRSSSDCPFQPALPGRADYELLAMKSNPLCISSLLFAQEGNEWLYAAYLRFLLRSRDSYSADSASDGEAYDVPKIVTSSTTMKMT